METLLMLFPNVQDLLITPPEDLVPVLLKLARGAVQNGMFWPDHVNKIATGSVSPVRWQPGYPIQHHQQIEALLMQAWTWAERNDLIVRAPGLNGRNGYMVFTRRGEQVSDAHDFRRLREVAEFPKSLIHPSITEKVWRSLMRNDLDEAVFTAFKAVEEAVRAAGGFAASDIGVPLMRKAFDKNTGPLTNMSHPEGEREGLGHLFAGAIGSYKNPHSHRTVNLSDLREAQEQIVLASHLLHIVDARREC